MEYGGRKYKEGIYSPITQNERHMTVLKECKAENVNMVKAAMRRQMFHLFHKSLVVLANPKTVVNDKYAKKEIKEQVLRADQLIKVIRRMAADSKERSSSKKEMMASAERMLARNKDERKDYFTKFEELVKENEIVQENVEKTVVETVAVTVAKIEVSVECEEQIVAESETISEVVSECEEQTVMDAKENLFCPKCGASLVRRTAKKGNNVGEQFFGCTSFPKCRFILKIEE